MNKALLHMKNLGILSLLEIFIIFICSILNLFLGNGNITTIILFIFNIILFLYFGFKFGKSSKKKGLLTGLHVGFGLIFFLFLINTIFYNNGININKILYYLILLLSCMFGAIVGKNKQSTN
jgi:putative membrane protein (TIGR04086 family)